MNGMKGGIWPPGMKGTGGKSGGGGKTPIKFGFGGPFGDSTRIGDGIFSESLSKEFVGPGKSNQISVPGSNLNCKNTH